VAADGRAVRDRGRVRVERLVQGQARPDGAQTETAKVEDSPEKEAGENRHALGARARHDAELASEFQYESLAERVVKEPGRAVAQKLVLRSQNRAGELGRTLDVDAARRE